ncbi:MAG: DegT/DnrJ/EryC1/StrS aminotransferase family protein [bacterium]|nr:DegT/DnrJ/EryC1/StrS aminotransferase family protein [bacterium]
MLNTPFSPWPSFSEEEADAVKKLLLSGKVNYWTGEECRNFEKEFAAFCGTSHAIALSNGTVSLELALKAIGVRNGDEVIVPPRTFFATASAVVAVGGIPIFADVDLDSQNITADSISKVLSPKTKAIIPVHLAGMPADMDPIMELAKKHSLYVVEDCAQAHGASYKGNPVGSIGHVGSWSFCQNKIMTTAGEGGMVTTNSQSLWEKMWSYKDHGRNYDAVYNRKHAPGHRWYCESFGTNWRMTEVSGCIGRLQLKKLSKWVEKRKKNAVEINKTLEKYDCIRVPKTPSYVEHSHYMHHAFVIPEKLGKDWDRERIILEINALGVPCYHGGCSEIYLEKAFEGHPSRPKNRLPVAKVLGETNLMFLVHPTLQPEEIGKTCSVLDTVLSKSSL